jgi:hypothetical protein
MSDTPETDAFRDSQFTDRVDEMDKLYDLAEKLERERDEWRKKFELSLDPMEIAARLARAESERDEAREDLEFRRGLYKVQEQCLETARRERDEARQRASDLALGVKV